MIVQNTQDTIKFVIELLKTVIEENEQEHQKSKAPAPSRMLTIKESTQAFPGLTEHTVRRLIAQGKIRHVRAGDGKRGKILIPEAALKEYLKIAD